MTRSLGARAPLHFASGAGTRAPLAIASTVHEYRIVRISPRLALLLTVLLIPATAWCDNPTAATKSASSASERVASQASTAAKPVTKDNQAKPPASGELSGDRLSDALVRLREAIANKQREIETTRGQRSAATDDTSIAAIEARLESLHRDANDLNRRFSRLVAGADESLFTTEPAEQFDPKEKLLGLLQPILLEVEQLTANSREISRLQTALDDQIRRRDEAVVAVANLDRALGDKLSSDVRPAVEELLDTWTRRRTEADAQIASIEYELAERQKTQKPFLNSAGSFVRSFLRTRGMHLALGFLAFLAVFLVAGVVRRTFVRMRDDERERQFTDRLLDLLYRSATFALAIGATLFVFNVTGDWFLLGIALTFLIGLGWVAIKTAPQFSQQITLVLNMGPVQEGECLVYEGLHWRVASLGFTVVLTNDRLQGGVQELPVRMIVGMVSRPLAPREELFPSCAGDWVRLDDGVTAMVDYQTPAVVQVRLLGGAPKVYSTAAFLAQNPQNLSGGFRLDLVFGIDYRHQADATRKIPAVMKERLDADLAQLLGAEQVRATRVEFQAAAASSLDYAVKVDLAGSVAARYSEIERATARSLVEACNANGWVIPFQQVTIHRAQA